jgi:xanthine dehydrogenase YagS FAD-binding subunit
MNPFTYTTVQGNQRALDETIGRNAKFIAGGTNLLDLMKFGVETPNHLIDINHLSLVSIENDLDGGVRIGALVRNSDLAYHPEIRRRYPVLSEALLSGASAQLRNMATVGGNLMQRTRCPYFYDVQFPCNKRAPQTGCSALNGYNRSHAVMGTSDSCIATHPSDMCVALAALGAIIHVVGVSQSRDIAFADFHKLPGDTPDKETALQSGEMITAVTIPSIPFARRSHYLKVRDRASYEFALASAAVALDISAGKIQAARIALGGIGTKPWRSQDAELALLGSEPTEAAFAVAASAALTGAQPRRHNAFKVELAKRTLVRALAEAGGMNV